MSEPHRYVQIKQGSLSLTFSPFYLQDFVAAPACRAKPEGPFVFGVHYSDQLKRKPGTPKPSGGSIITGRPVVSQKTMQNLSAALP